jgi:hypothetical protein
VFGALLLLH